MFTQSSERDLTSLNSAVTQYHVMPETITHSHHSGINPLVDAAATLFSLAGQYARLTHYDELNELQIKLIHEINVFQKTIEARHYNAEIVLISRYTLCATLDDVFSHTEWGAHEKWKPYSLLQIFHQEKSAQQERIFLILERLIKQPNIYIELMELMYFCLSLGLKGSDRPSNFTQDQLNITCDTLYQHIRAYRGELNKTLSPFSTKILPIKDHIVKIKTFSPLTVLLTTICCILLIFVGLNFILDTSSHQMDHKLIQIGKNISHETINI